MPAVRQRGHENKIVKWVGIILIIPMLAGVYFARSCVDDDVKRHEKEGESFREGSEKGIGVEAPPPVSAPTLAVPLDDDARPSPPPSSYLKPRASASR